MRSKFKDTFFLGQPFCFRPNEVTKTLRNKKIFDKSFVTFDIDFLTFQPRIVNNSTINFKRCLLWDWSNLIKNTNTNFYRLLTLKVLDKSHFHSMALILINRIFFTSLLEIHSLWDERKSIFNEKKKHLEKYDNVIAPGCIVSVHLFTRLKMELFLVKRCWWFWHLVNLITAFVL